MTMICPVQGAEVPDDDHLKSHESDGNFISGFNIPIFYFNIHSFQLRRKFHVNVSGKMSCHVYPIRLLDWSAAFEQTMQ